MTERDPTMTLVLDGDVPLDLFAKAVGGFRELVDALTKEVGGAAIMWVVADLSIGSTSMTVRAETEQSETAWQVVGAYAEVGRALERGDRVPYGERVTQPIRAITGVLNGRVPSLRFETEDDVALVTTGGPEHLAGRAVSGAYGSVEGTVETASKRRGLRFTLYDALNDRAVACYLRSDQVDLVRGAWGRRALVRGWLTRDARTGRPLKISPVEAIEILPDVETGSYRQARGVLAGLRGTEPPEVTLRRLRDDW